MYNSGLVLEGGGMRGIFTAGVLDFFMDRDVDFENIIAVSAGACHACSFLSKQYGRAKNVSIDYIDDKNYCSIHNLLNTGDMFSEKFVYDEIPRKLNVFDNDTYESNPSKLFVTVTNVEDGEPEYILLQDCDKDIDLIRASASLPLISRLVEFRSKMYLDGGISDSIPIRKAQEMGMKKNVIILTQPEGYIKKPNKAMAIIKMKYKKYPQLVRKMANRYLIYNDTLDYISEEEKKGNVFVMRPLAALPLKRIEKDKDKLEWTYREGYECAKSRYEDMIEYLSK